MSNSDWFVISVLMSGFFSYILASWIYRKKTRPIVHKILFNSPCEWAHISTLPSDLLDSYRIRNIIVTDGIDIESEPFMKYNKYGKLIMGYSSNEITHWMPFPAVPKHETHD